ncbi:MAG: hypothetical protein KF868_22590 [Acidobacteria bacterium]|nr:hypothetical protein [Acidobacteriota bacterium]
MKTAIRTALAAGTLALAAGAISAPASAAPAGNLEALKNTTAQTTNVQWRRHHHGRNAAIGLGAFGAGVVIGSALANQGGYYDAPYGYYEQPYGYYQQPYGNWSANRSGNQPDSWDNPADYVGK